MLKWFACSTKRTHLKRKPTVDCSLGLNSATIPNADLETGIRAAADAGFSFYEPRVPLLADFEKKGSRDRAVSVLRRSSLEWLPLNALEGLFKLDSGTFLSRADEIFSLAGRFGIPQVIVVPGQPAHGTTSIREAQETLRGVRDRASLHGVSLLYELIGFPAHAFPNLERAYTVVESVGIPLVLDTFHLAVSQASTRKIASLPSEAIGLVHLSDALTAGRALKDSLDQDRVLPGEGRLPLVGILEATASTGYQGLVSVEVSPPRYRSGNVIPTKSPRRRTDEPRRSCKLQVGLFEPSGLSVYTKKEEGESMKRIRVGIIGAGRIGKLHAENLTYRIPDAQVVAIADVDVEAARACATKLGIPSVYTDPSAIFADADIDAVLICSSTDTHASLIEEAAEAGKHIFCEKPIALDLAAIDRALQAVEKTGVLLQVGFNRRFDPNFRRAQELVTQGAIGKPHVLRITSRDPEPPPIDYVKVSGGIFLDMTIHDFDMARYLMQDEVEEVYAAGAVLVDPRIVDLGDVDTAAVTLHFRSGAIGVIDNSRRAVYGYDQRAEVFGEKGAIVVSNPKPDTAVISDEQGDHTSPLLHFFVERYTDSYVAEIKAFIKCIRSGKEPPVTGLDGKVAVVMGYAAKLSYEEHRPVRLTEIDPNLV